MKPAFLLVKLATSEKIVPSGHNAHQTPEAIEEVHRILKLHQHTLD